MLASCSSFGWLGDTSWSSCAKTCFYRCVDMHPNSLCSLLTRTACLGSDVGRWHCLLPCQHCSASTGVAPPCRGACVCATPRPPGVLRACILRKGYESVKLIMCIETLQKSLWTVSIIAHPRPAASKRVNSDGGAAYEVEAAPRSSSPGSWCLASPCLLLPVARGALVLLPPPPLPPPLALPPPGNHAP